LSNEARRDLSWGSRLIERKTRTQERYKGVTFTVDETGREVMIVPTDTHVVRSKRQIEEAARKQLAEKGRGQDFTFSAMEHIHEVASVLTTAQCGYLLLLQCYIDYDDGRLINADRTSMSTADMMDVLQLKRKRQTFYDFFHACLENGIIIANEDGSYSVNKRYHFKGATDNPFVIRSYTAKIRQVYREVKAVDLGLIYRMLPFVHYETNALCANPNARNPDEIRWFNRKELAQAIGVSEGEISRRLPKITLGNEYVIARVTVGGQTYYMFNPLVFYRSNKAPDATARAMFNVKARGK
jgi:hypothetical protein